MHGFQLWANLPSSLKMTAPRYQDISGAEIPEVIDDDGTRVRVICGEFWGKRGPVEGVAADPRYLDISVPPGQRKTPAGRDRRGTPSPTCSTGSGTFRDASAAVRRADREGDRRQRVLAASRPAIARSCSSTAATRSPCRPATRASASCWSQASRSRNRSRGTDRS